MVLLLLLDLFPRSRHLVRIVGGYLPKDVRVAPHELVGFRLNDVCECKSPLLFRNGGVEEHVQKDIAELLRQRVPVALVDRAHHLVGLFNEQVLHRLVRLRPVPGTVAPQLLHDGHNVRERLQPFRRRGKLVFVDLVGGVGRRGSHERANTRSRRECVAETLHTSAVRVYSIE